MWTVHSNLKIDIDSEYLWRMTFEWTKSNCTPRPTNAAGYLLWRLPVIGCKEQISAGSSFVILVLVGGAFEVKYYGMLWSNERNERCVESRLLFNGPQHVYLVPTAKWHSPAGAAVLLRFEGLRGVFWPLEGFEGLAQQCPGLPRREQSSESSPSRQSGWLPYLCESQQWEPMQAAADLTHCRLVTHMCVIIGLGNGLAPNRCQAITWTKAALLSNEPTGTILNCTKIQKFFVKKMLLKTLSKMSSIFYLNVLITPFYYDDA